MRTLVSTLALSLALAAGCAPSNPGLVVVGVVAPPAGGACEYDPSATAFLVSGVLDTLDQDATFDAFPGDYFGVRYVAHLAVQNHLLNLFNNRYPLRPDVNFMIAMSADVSITQIDGSPFAFAGLPNPFRVAASGSIPSASSDTPGAGIVTVELIPPQYGALLAGLDGPRLNVSVRVNGRTTGDAAVQTPEFFFSIDLCEACLYACSTDVEGAFSCDIGQDGLTLIPAGVGPCPPPVSP